MAMLRNRLTADTRTMENITNRRLELELEFFHQNILGLPHNLGSIYPPDYKLKFPCTASPVGGNLSHWIATMPGPPSSPYEGVTFEISIECPESYPIWPPKVTFLTKVFHPNIDNKGNINLQILKKNEWRVNNNITEVLYLTYHLLARPNLDDVVSPEIADMYKRDGCKFDRIARSRSLTEMYAWEQEWE